MTLHATLDSREETVIIVLAGDLDAAGAPIFEETLEKAVGHAPKRLVLELSQLNYLSSAGLRQLVYAQQKLADDVRIVLVRANEKVRHTIRLVGFDQSISFADQVPE